MTVFLPLEDSSPFPQSPPFLLPSAEPKADVSKVLKAIMKAKRIVVVCGAGISVQAGIPDFRSPEGLFQTLKKDNPKEVLTSGKDLFDASVFNSEHTTSLFCQMIARLSELSQAASPTPFHQILRALDDRGKLLRVYTQNIDAIELKSGLSFGVPDFDGRRKPKSRDRAALTEPITPVGTPPSNRLPTPPAETPRCIPLHGTLQTLHCQTCTHSVPLEDHLPSLTSGTPPRCPECTAMEQTRQLVGKRARGVGKLRPSVVLYNEMHKNGEGVGEAVRKDLVGTSKGKGRSGADLLLVVGTSLRVPGTKRIVREFAKAVHCRGSTTKEPPNLGLLTPSPSPRRSPASDEEPPMKTIYLNLDFPVPTREWEGVFDVWLQGDAQSFAEMLNEQVENEVRSKEAAIERKRRKDEDAADGGRKADAARKTDGKKRKAVPDSPLKLAKRRKLAASSQVGKGNSITTIPQSKVAPQQKHMPGMRPRLMLRIPPRASAHTRKLFVPEVYITSSPPKSSIVRRQSVLQTVRTPPSTPRGRATTFAPSNGNEDEDIDVDVEESDVLPNEFIRTIQYGLRSTR